MSAVKTKKGDTQFLCMDITPVAYFVFMSRYLTYWHWLQWASLKNYLDEGNRDIKDSTKAVEYTHAIALQIYVDSTTNVRHVPPDKSFSILGLGSASNLNSMMSSMMSTDVFSQMPTNPNLYQGQYDIKKAGKIGNPIIRCHSN